MRAATGAHTPIDAVLAWPWHRMLFVWAEARDMHEETWGLLLSVYYEKRRDD